MIRVTSQRLGGCLPTHWGPRSPKHFLQKKKKISSFLWLVGLALSSSDGLTACEHMAYLSCPVVKECHSLCCLRQGLQVGIGRMIQLVPGALLDLNSRSEAMLPEV